jgi:2-C-methyl-D-erythritol 4-phosphate cytidylyltransferase
VDGDERNMKVTDPVDLFIADKLFQLASSAAAPVSAEQLRNALVGKVVVVFGASYGIGETIADLAEEHGAHVHRFSRSGSGTHVERRHELKEAARKVHDVEGRIDHVVNAAGVLPRGPLSEMSEEAVYQATEINYLAPVFIAQEFHRYLRETQGSLLLFTSSSYTRGRKDYSLYSSAKAAVVNLTQALADEWSPDGISVNCINPERTATPMRAKAFGTEAPETLLDPRHVARISLAAVVNGETGHVIDVRLDDPITEMAAMHAVISGD